MTTTVPSEDGATIAGGDSGGNGLYRVCWSAAFAGALLSFALIVLLFALGAGVGLSPIPAGTPRFLTLGGIFFFAAQTFGFAAGGFLTGHLLPPVFQTGKESQFRAASHGLLSWALAVVATAGIAGAAMPTGTGAFAAAAAALPKPVHALSPDAAGYWVDQLFRGASPASRASLPLPRYAQYDDGFSGDAPTDAPQAPPSSAPTTPVITTQLAPPPDARSIAVDKAEAMRILVVSLADGGRVSPADKAYIARLIATDAALSRDAADARVKDIEQSAYARLKQKAETTRKTIAYASLWTALALLFGGIAATVMAMAARRDEVRTP